MIRRVIKRIHIVSSIFAIPLLIVGFVAWTAIAIYSFMFPVPLLTQAVAYSFIATLAMLKLIDAWAMENEKTETTHLLDIINSQNNTIREYKEFSDDVKQFKDASLNYQACLEKEIMVHSVLD